jgi:hypothetical protein
MGQCLCKASPVYGPFECTSVRREVVCEPRLPIADFDQIDAKFPTQVVHGLPKALAPTGVSTPEQVYEYIPGHPPSID